MKITFKITYELYRRIQADLQRPHAIAAERVGWLRCRVGDAPKGGLLLLAYDYYPVADDDYIDDPSVGAMMGSGAIRKALQLALDKPISIFHVHMHDHQGQPHFSGVDTRETAKFVPDFWHVRPGMPHGAMILSQDDAYGRCWYPGGKIIEINDIVLVGAPRRTHGRTTHTTKLPRNK